MVVVLEMCHQTFHQYFTGPLSVWVLTYRCILVATVNLSQNCLHCLGIKYVFTVRGFTFSGNLSGRFPLLIRFHVIELLCDELTGTESAGNLLQESCLILGVYH